MYRSFLKRSISSVALMLASAALLTPQIAEAKWRDLDPIRQTKRVVEHNKKSIRVVTDTACAAGRFVARQNRSALKSTVRTARLAAGGHSLKAVVRSSLQPVRDTDDNAFRMTQESSAINLIAQTAATFYGGMAGAAAYSGWQSYHAFGGNWNQAFKSAGVSALTSYANEGVLNTFPGSSRLVSRVLAQGAVGGLSAQALGGEFNDGFASAAVGELGTGLLPQSSSLTGQAARQGVIGCTVALAGSGACGDGARASLISTATLTALQPRVAVEPPLADVSTTPDASLANAGATRDADETANGGVQLVVNEAHPVGDYARAMFDTAFDQVNDMAASVPEARGLKGSMAEAASARSFYEALTPSVAPPSLLAGDASGFGGVELLSNFAKIQLLGSKLHLETTSTTGGVHNTGSAHYRAGAVDFRVRDLPPERAGQTMFAMRVAGLYVRDERGRPLRADGTPQPAWSAPHIHAQSVPTTVEKNGPLDRWSQPPYVPGTFMRFPGK
jgi:hypothetical protein